MRRLSVWWYVEPVERSRTSYVVLVRSVSNDNTVEELGVSGFFFTGHDVMHLSTERSN